MHTWLLFLSLKYEKKIWRLFIRCLTFARLTGDQWELLHGLVNFSVHCSRSHLNFTDRILDQCSELITPSIKPSQNQTIPSILYAVTEQQQRVQNWVKFFPLSPTKTRTKLKFWNFFIKSLSGLLLWMVDCYLRGVNCHSGLQLSLFIASDFSPMLL